MQFTRRQLLQASAAGLGSMLLPSTAFAGEPALPSYQGPNVIIVRFGGGVRRQECIENPQQTYCPYFLQKLAPQGVLYRNMNLSHDSHIETSHGQGTLFILSGKYEAFQDVHKQPLKARFESQVPTVFEYLRKQYAIPVHQTLIVNHEDRRDEEFYTFSNHKNFGFDYRSDVLSLYRYKVFLLRQQIESGTLDSRTKEKKIQQLKKLEELDYRRHVNERPNQKMQEFWQSWQGHFGSSGFVNPRGDRLLCELSIWAMEKLQPKLMMVNFNDPDYVHWGLPHHYTEGIKTIDQCMRRLHERAQALPNYRDNTIFVIVPDCGRDNNRFMEVPYQHHFNTRSAREIFALIYGKGVPKGKVIDKPVEQISIASTVAALMGVQAKHAEGDVLSEVFA